MRIDLFLVNRMEKVSRNRIQNAARAGAILVNGKAVKPNYRIKPNEEVVLVLPYEPHISEVLPEPIDLEILYEDEVVIVINKPAGLVVHPGQGNWTGTLVNGLLSHFTNLPNALPGNPTDPSSRMRPGLVHRLDKDTTGVMVVAKTEFALAHLAKQFF